MTLDIRKEAGSVRVSVNMKPTDKPIFLHRINLVWFDANGNAFAAQSHRPDQFIEENISILVLSVPTMSGAKQVKAEACYEVVEGVAKTSKLSL
ncbi:MAG TPA: hypothetical protein VMW56_24460 [Candidatus Margulisiibacteriota bacterium]|nr:hypothetical protein [Candidatus Margulisiibacteriota bacterium]